MENKEQTSLLSTISQNRNEKKKSKRIFLMYLSPVPIIYDLVYQNSHIKLVVVVNSALKKKTKRKEKKRKARAVTLYF